MATRQAETPVVRELLNKGIFHSPAPTPATMTHPISRAALALLLTVSAAGVLAQSTPPVSRTLDFEDLAAPAGSTSNGNEIFTGALRNGYAGFNWAGFGPAGTPSGNYFSTENKLTGNNYVALSGGGSFITRSDGADFFFDGLDVWSRRGLDANGDFSFMLYNNGQTVYNGSTDKAGRNVFTGTSQTFLAEVFGSNGNAAYSGPIDAMAFFFDNDDYDHMAFDNLQVRVSAIAPGTPARTSVPEPGSHALLLAGLGLIGVVLRGRRTVD